MKEQADRHYVGNSYSIEVVEDGFVLDYWCSGDRRRCFNRFSDLVRFLALRMDIIKIGEKLLLKGCDS